MNPLTASARLRHGLPWLGGLSPAQFMRRHWQRRPLLIRQAWPDIEPPLSAQALFELAARDDVESRLVRQDASGWRLRQGPLGRRSLPSLKQPGWTLLVQGVDQQVPAARELLRRCDFLPAARLDDVMVSFATDGGGVGPHVDSYDVFLLQVQGRRRWKIAPPARQARFLPGLPLRILADFEPTEDWLLEPGDMLYLPPGWGHDGVAEGACMTCSIGFRAPRRDELAREVTGRALEALADAAAEQAEDAAREGATAATWAPEASGGPLYRDASQPATDQPGSIPAALRAFGRAAVRRALADDALLDRALGEYLTEPKSLVSFEPAEAAPWPQAADDARLVLDARSRLLYDERHVYLNGASYRASGRDARLLRQWADRGMLSVRHARGLSAAAQDLLQDWLDDGWVHLEPTV